MREYGRDRSVPLFITLLVMALVVLTFDIRSNGSGVMGSIRQGTNQILSPLQRLGSAAVSPVADLVDNLRDIAGLREENESLRALLAETQARQAALETDLARLEVLERLLDLQLDVQELVRTNANVIGRADNFDYAFKIDRGEESGVLVGHPVLDENGYLVGRVYQSWNGGAIVMPLIEDVEGVTVIVGDQVGTLMPVVGSDEMTLDVFEEGHEVRAGDQVVTSQLSEAFPRSMPVGEVIADADPQGNALTARVRPFADLQRLEAVVVLAWPPDPVTATEDDVPPVADSAVPTDPSDGEG